MYAFNIFIPGELKIVGPDVNESAILTYVDKVFQRCQGGWCKQNHLGKWRFASRARWL